VFFTPEVVISFQETPHDCLEGLRDRIRTARPKIRSSGTDYLACMVVDSIVDGYFPVLEHYGDRIERLEEEVFERGDDDILQVLYRTRRDLTGFRRAVWPLREALGQLNRDPEAPLGDDVRLHLRDVIDHTLQVSEVNESYGELVSNLVEMHLSLTAHRTNDVMRVLTLVATIFIPLSFVAGVYGMNFDTSAPANLPELGWPFGYAFFWSICLTVAGFLLVMFYRLGWLRRPR
jgi:magnesium transporter